MSSRACDHVAPPGVLDVALELDAERTVVPAARQPAVDLARLEDEPAPLGEVHDLLHRRLGHAVKRSTLARVWAKATRGQHASRGVSRDARAVSAVRRRTRRASCVDQRASRRSEVERRGQVSGRAGLAGERARVGGDGGRQRQRSRGRLRRDRRAAARSARSQRTRVTTSQRPSPRQRAQRTPPRARSDVKAGGARSAVAPQLPAAVELRLVAGHLQEMQLEGAQHAALGVRRARGAPSASPTSSIDLRHRLRVRGSSDRSARAT